MNTSLIIQDLEEQVSVIENRLEETTHPSIRTKLIATLDKIRTQLCQLYDAYVMQVFREETPQTPPPYKGLRESYPFITNVNARGFDYTKENIHQKTTDSATISSTEF